MKRFSLTAIDAVLLGLTYYLHSMDHSTYHGYVGSILVINGSGYAWKPPTVIPPPWYANLWPVFLVTGLVLLGLEIYWMRAYMVTVGRSIRNRLESSKIVHGVKALYRKWNDYEFGWQEEESPFKVHKPDE